MLGFALKKVISRLLFPLPVCILLLTAGLVLAGGTRRRRTGLALAWVGLALLVAAAYGVPARTALRRLEWRHAAPRPEQTLRQLTGTSSGRVWVVVLGSGSAEDADLPANSRLDPRFLARVVEGARLLRQDPEAALILSLPGRLPVAAKQALLTELCQTLGIDPRRAQLLTTALDTEDEARLTAAIVGDEPLALVTSAAHLPRSMLLFRGAGMAPVACPTDFLTQRPGTPGQFHPAGIYPAATDLCLSERAVYEYLGIAWAWLRGQTTPPEPRALALPQAAP